MLVLILFLAFLELIQGQIVFRSQSVLTPFNVTGVPNLSAFPTTAKGTADFSFHLSNVTFDDLINSSQNYLIVDPQYSQLTREQVDHLKARNKVVLAYLDVTHTSNQRPYWRYQWDDNRPEFILSEFVQDNSSSYETQFWSPVWERILLRFIREYILTSRYSGIYLDGVEDYDKNTSNGGGRMVALIARIAAQARAIAPGTLIFVESSADVYALPDLKNLIDGVGVRDIWFENDAAVASEDNSQLKVALLAQQEGKVVLAMDESVQRGNICGFYERCYVARFLCAVIADEQLGTSSTRNCIKLPTTAATLATTATTIGTRPDQLVSSSAKLLSSCLHMLVTAILCWRAS